MISATQLYNYCHCPHRVFLDANGDPALRDEPSAFEEMLWDQGVSHEARLVSTLGITADLSGIPEGEREQATIEAMKRGEPMIYAGRITSGHLVGKPDLLERREGGYIPGDIKSGSGLEGDEDDGKLKKHYAFQIAHYCRILLDKGFSDGSRDAFIVDRKAERVGYPLGEPQGVRNKASWWDAYHQALAEVEALVGGAPSRGALSAKCKLCAWRTHCKKTLIAANDLTLIPELGRSKRDAIAATIPTVQQLAACNPENYVAGKKTAFPGIGPDTLRKFHARAKLLTTPGAKPYLKEPVSLPERANEVFFDIEADPFRDVVYLHGFVERPHGNPAAARYVPFFAEGVSEADDRAVFAAAWAYLQARRQDSAIYYYSSYELGAYKKLARKYPDVCSEEDVKALFADAVMVDLYEVVRGKTEWPTYDHSVKTLAVFLGFKWRDPNPSGAASIEWFNRFIESADPQERADLKKRILAYNEDDNLATAVVLEGIRALQP